ncbi:MAG TPA: GNAT family N-acetyltransferase [Azospirillaceae bacterium]|nr:GNAT family N-acetyltransferase [Azospirillaceae bacterium]
MAPPTIRVRPARPGDEEAVAAMIAALASEEGAPPPSLTPARFRRAAFAERPLLRALLADLDGRPAGVALLTHGYDTGTASAGLVVEDLYVEPLARRRGVARALLAEAAREARRAGGEWLSWHVRSRNVPAQLFYRSLGADAEAVHLMGLSGEAFQRLAGS